MGSDDLTVRKEDNGPSVWVAPGTVRPKKQRSRFLTFEAQGYRESEKLQLTLQVFMELI